MKRHLKTDAFTADFGCATLRLARRHTEKQTTALNVGWRRRRGFCFDLVNVFGSCIFRHWFLTRKSLQLFFWASSCAVLSFDSASTRTDESSLKISLFNMTSWIRTGLEFIRHGYKSESHWLHSNCNHSSKDYQTASPHSRKQAPKSKPGTALGQVVWLEKCALSSTCEVPTNLLIYWSF